MGTALETQAGLSPQLSGSPLTLLPWDLRIGRHIVKPEFQARHLGARSMALTVLGTLFP